MASIPWILLLFVTLGASLKLYPSLRSTTANVKLVEDAAIFSLLDRSVYNFSWSVNSSTSTGRYWNSTSLTSLPINITSPRVSNSSMSSTQFTTTAILSTSLSPMTTSGVTTNNSSTMTSCVSCSPVTSKNSTLSSRPGHTSQSQLNATSPSNASSTLLSDSQISTESSSDSFVNVSPPAPQTIANTTDSGAGRVIPSATSNQVTSPITQSTTNTSRSTIIPVLVTITEGSAISLITLTPTTTIAPTGTEAVSREAELRGSLTAIFPAILGWIKTPKEKPTPVVHALEDIKVSAEGLLADVGDDPSQKGSGCTSSLFGLLSCIVQGLAKVESGIDSGVVDDAEVGFGELQSLPNPSNDQSPTSSPKSSSSTRDSSSSSEKTSSGSSKTSTSSSSKTSSSSCSSTTTTEFSYIFCDVTSSAIPSQTVTTCNTLTSTISGCDITAFATATTSATSCADTSITEDLYVLCYGTDTAASQPSESCSTMTSTITGCFLSAVTSTTVVSNDTLCGFDLSDSTDTSLEPTWTGPSCTDCATVSGEIYGPLSTVLPVGASLPANISEVPGGINKRTLPVPADYPGPFNYVNFMLDQFFRANLILVHPRKADIRHQNPIAGAKFISLETAAFGIGVGRLNGCFSIFVCSRKGVWVSRHWETAFAFDATFQTETQKIQYGDGTSGMRGLSQYMGDGKPFSHQQEDGSQNLIAVVVAVPGIKQSGQLSMIYPEKVRSLYYFLRSMFLIDPHVYVYDKSAKRKGTWYGTSSHNKLLFRYDPVQARIPEQFNLYGAEVTCNIQYAATNLYFAEAELVHSDIWFATAEQLVLATQDGSNPGGSKVLAIPPGSFPSPQNISSKMKERLFGRDVSLGPACHKVSNATSDRSGNPTKTSAPVSGILSTSSKRTQTTAIGTDNSPEPTRQTSISAEDSRSTPGTSAQSTIKSSVEVSRSGDVTSTKDSPSTFAGTALPTINGSAELSTSSNNTVSTSKKSASMESIWSSPSSASSSITLQDSSSKTIPASSSKTISASSKTVPDSSSEAITTSLKPTVASSSEVTPVSSSKMIPTSSKTIPISLSNITPVLSSTTAASFAKWCILATYPAIKTGSASPTVSEYCTCEDGTSETLSSTTDTAGSTFYFCNDGGPTNVLVSSAGPSPSYFPGVCDVHIWEASLGESSPVAVQVNISDGHGTILTSQVFNGSWGITHTVLKSLTTLPYDIVITMLAEVPYLSAVRKATGVPKVQPPPPPPDDSQKYVVALTAGSTVWNSTQQNNATLPYCKVGTWDNGDFLDWLRNILSFGTDKTYPNRQMDCHFSC